MKTREYFVWVEKYRPLTLSDCILPKALTATLKGIIAKQDMPNLLFHGRAGTGKTTVAKALCKDLGADAMLVNASDDRGIELIRTRIKDYASSTSLSGTRKYVILDEADQLTNDAQPALKAMIEEFSHNCGFIFTCNDLQRMIEPLQSRCSVIDFAVPAAERNAIAVAYMSRCSEILTTEEVTFDKKVLQQVIINYFPDFRRVLNELQRHSGTGELSEAVLAMLSEKDINNLFDTLKKKDFPALRKWLIAHEDMNDTAFYRMLHHQVIDRIQPNLMNEVIIMMADYAYRTSRSADKSLTALACLVELMNGGAWK